MGGNVLVSLLVTGVLGDEVEVFLADDDGSVHLGGNDGTGQDTATDRDETSEGALLVCRVKMLVTRSNMHVLCVAQFLLAQFRGVVSSLFPVFVVVRRRVLPQVQILKISNLSQRTDVAALNGGLGGSETKTDVLVPSSATLARSGALGLGLRVLEDVRLLLESTLRLDGQLGRPDGEVSDSFGFDIVNSFAVIVTDILNYPSRAGTVTRWRVVA